MKINRHGRAKILTTHEIQLVFSHGLDSERDKTLFGVCLFSACRIREACTLLTEDIYTPNGKVRPRLIIRKANTKGKLATRSIPVIEDLRQLLNNYYPISSGAIYFTGGGFGSAIIASKVTEIITAHVNEVMRFSRFGRSVSMTVNTLLKNRISGCTVSSVGIKT